MRGGFAPSARARCAGAGLAGVVVLAGGVAVCLLASCRSPPAEGPVARLADAAAGVRVGRARLTGGFAHAECPDRLGTQPVVAGLLCASPPPWEWPDAGALEQVAVDLKRAANGDDARHRHAVGLWHLLVGEPEQAVTELRAASRFDSPSAAVQSDLAAAYLALAESAGDPGAIALAYVAADSALSLDSSLAEARFNLAVALEWLFLERDAIAAWDAYLAADARSPWAAEARMHRERLSRPAPAWRDDSLRLRVAGTGGDAATVRAVVERFPSQVREAILETLATWARARGRAEEDADAALDFARALAKPLAHVTGNTLPAEAIDAIDEALAGRDRARLDHLVAGQLALTAGIALADPGSLYPAGALAALTEARDRLTRARSPLAAWAEYHGATVWYQQTAFDAYERALEGLRSVRRTVPQRYVVVRSRAAMLIGLIHHIRANYDAAVAAYDTTVAEAAATGEPALLLRPRSWIVSIRLALEGARPAWQALYGALKLTARFPEAHQAHYSAFSDAAQHTSLVAPRLALRFQGEVVRAAVALDDSLRWAYALLRRAEHSARAGDGQLALADLSAAGAIADDISTGASRAGLAADIEIVSGQVYLPNDPERALEALRRVTDAYRRTDFSLVLRRAYTFLAAAFLAAGRSDSAEAAFEAAIAETERQRELVAALAQRAQFLDHARPVFDQIVRLYADRGEAERGFEYFERMRSRMLFERVVGRAERARPRRLSAREVSRRLPRGVNLVSYAVLDEEVLVWLVRAAGVHLERVPVAASRVAALVDDLQASILNPTRRDDFDGLSQRLYELLVEPVAGDLDPGAALVFVPDKWLHFVPFAALRHPRTSRFLVEDRVVVLAPSAALFIEAVEGSQERLAPRAPRVLAIGNPLLDRSTVQLPDLPGAAREAVAVADAYGTGDVLLGAEATRTAFRARAQGYDVIHFAGHAVLRTDAPLQSHLLFAPEPGDGGAAPLYARDLFAWRLDRTRLAILSGCHTAGGALSPTEGASSLARAFFAAGVPAVVASLWAVEDEETAEFFATYHRKLSAGEAPAAALRSTQVEWIERGRQRMGRVATWAAFQVFGWGGEGRTEMPKRVRLQEEDSWSGLQPFGKEPRVRVSPAWSRYREEASDGRRGSTHEGPDHLPRPGAVSLRAERQRRVVRRGRLQAPGPPDQPSGEQGRA